MDRLAQMAPKKAPLTDYQPFMIVTPKGIQPADKSLATRTWYKTPFYDRNRQLGPFLRITADLHNG